MATRRDVLCHTGSQGLPCISEATCSTSRAVLGATPLVGLLSDPNRAGSPAPPAHSLMISSAALHAPRGLQADILMPARCRHGHVHRTPGPSERQRAAALADHQAGHQAMTGVPTGKRADTRRRGKVSCVGHRRSEHPHAVPGRVMVVASTNLPQSCVGARLIRGTTLPALVTHRDSATTARSRCNTRPDRLGQARARSATDQRQTPPPPCTGRYLTRPTHLPVATSDQLCVYRLQPSAR